MEYIKFLSDDDIVILKLLLKKERERIQNTTNRPGDKPDVAQTPETFVALIPDTGISALNDLPGTGSGTGTWSELGKGDIPGATECSIYRLLPAANGDDPYLSKAFTELKVVYNLFDAITHRTWAIVTKDKWGTWWVVSTGEGTGASGASADGPQFIGPVHVVNPPGTGSGDPWYCQAVEWDGGKWVITDDGFGQPVDYEDVIEINEMDPRLGDTTDAVGYQANAVTNLFRDAEGQYYIDYPRLSASDTVTTPNTWECDGDTITPATYVTVRTTWDNYTNFPDVSLVQEIV